jgi:hypothetical protein
MIHNLKLGINLIGFVIYMKNSIMCQFNGYLNLKKIMIIRIRIRNNGYGYYSIRLHTSRRLIFVVMIVVLRTAIYP